jgi:hypothetical protein
MPVLVITNNTSNPSSISDPEHEFSEGLPANATSTFTVPQHTIDNLKAQLDDLASRLDDGGTKEFIVDVQAETDDAGGEFEGVAGLLRWTGNHVKDDTVVTNPTTPSTLAIRRVNIAAGVAVVDAAIFTYIAAADEVGDAEIDKDGADVSGVALVAATDTWMHVVMVNNAGTREVVFVRGDSVPTAEVPSKLSEAQIAAAIGVYLAAGGPYANYVRIEDSVFTNGITSQTTTSIAPVPAAYS